MRAISKKSKKLECRNCGTKTHFISLNGNCIKCSENKAISAVFQLKAREGPVYEKYRQNLINALTKK